ncbi:hypothetical protein MMC25_000268 [Agyrium rufum]|nr:hypothetical protein [Agyrium rufum]
MAVFDINVTNGLIAATVLYGIYYAYWQLTVGAAQRKIIAEHGCKPVNPLPQWETIIGWDLFNANRQAIKEKRLLSTNLKRFLDYGRTWQVRVLGRTFISTIEPENLKQIQSLQFKNWSLGTERKVSFRVLLGDGIFTTDGAAWHRSREMLRPNFVRSQVGDLVTFEQHVDHLLQAIPRDGTTVDLGELFFRLTIDSATEFLFGDSTNCLAPGTSTESSSKFAEAFNRAQEGIGNNARNGVLMRLLPTESQFQKDCKFVHEFVDRFVERGLREAKEQDLEKGGRYVFLRELCKQTQDKIAIRSELLNILLAGRDTTASLLSNTFFVLAKRPDIWQKLQAEIEPLGDEPPTFDQIKNMKYLRYVLNEGLRCYPVVPGNSREAIVDTWLPLGGGKDGKSPMFIPKGQVVAWSVYSMHRRKDFFGEDADEFKPERWETLRPGWEYLPFNGGPRICIGQQFALTEASYTIIRILQEFKGIESRDPRPWMESLTLTCTSLNGAQVFLTPRKPT